MLQGSRHAFLDDKSELSWGGELGVVEVEVEYFTFFSKMGGKLTSRFFLPDVYEISIQANSLYYSLTPVDILVGR